MAAVTREVLARLLEACEVLERHAARLTATGDPIGETISLCAIMAKCLHSLAVDLTHTAEAHTQAFGTMIEGSRKPLTREELRTMGGELHQWLVYHWKRMNQWAVVGCSAATLVFGAACWAGGYFMANGRIEALNQAVTGPEAANWAPVLRMNNLADAWSHCRPLPQPHGGRACAFPLWTQPPPPEAGR